MSEAPPVAPPGRRRALVGHVRRVGGGASRAASFAVEVILPRICAGCGERGAWVCDYCRAEIALAGDDGCARCGSPACECDDVPRSLALIRSVGPHDGWLQASVHAVKFQGQTARVPELSRLMRPVIEDLLRHEPTAVVVPVPLHRSRERERGFNQSTLLASHACRGLPVTIDERAAWRTRRTLQQVGLSPEERIANMIGAFEANPERVAARPIILIDDVYTTGSTTSACADALHRAGAGSVAVVSVTRATWHRSTWSLAAVTTR